MMSPAICTAVNSTWTMKPRAAPMSASVIAVTMRNPAVIAGRSPLMCGKTTRARAMASAPLTATGMPAVLKGGARITNPLARTVASSSAARVAEGTWRSTAASALAEQPRQLVEQLVGEGDQLREHPVAGHQQRDRDRDHLRHEGQRLFLDLGRRLEQRDHEADQQGRQQDRGGDLRADQHRLGGDLGDVGVAHEYDPTSAVVISDHPSTITNSSSLKGSDTTDGGTIIMPIDISAALTSMSSTRNGMKMTSPMMKALFSSESTNAGMRVSMLPDASSAGFSSPDSPIISLSSSSRVLSSRKVFNGASPTS